MPRLPQIESKPAIEGGSGAVSNPQALYRKDGKSGIKGWQGLEGLEEYCSVYSSISFFLCSLRALNSMACCFVRCFSISSSFFNSSASICFLYFSIFCLFSATAAAKSLAPGGLTYVTGGYSPTLIRRLSGGIILGSRINGCFSSRGQPRLPVV
jgi:hypothetical protein